MARFDHCQLHGESCSVLAQPHHLAADTDDFFLPGLQVVGEITIVRFVVGGGHEHGNILFDHFDLGVTEYALGGGVEGSNRTIFVNCNDALNQVIQHGADMRFAVAQLTDDLHQTIVHFFQGLHQLADFIRRPNFDLLRKVACGNATSNLHCFLQRPENSSGECDAYQYCQCQDNNYQGDENIAYGRVAVLLVSVFLFCNI